MGKRKLLVSVIVSRTKSAVGMTARIVGRSSFALEGFLELSFLPGLDFVGEDYEGQPKYED
jgi:hypothetical protein